MSSKVMHIINPHTYSTLRLFPSKVCTSGRLRVDCALTKLPCLPYVHDQSIHGTRCTEFLNAIAIHCSLPSPSGLASPNSLVIYAVGPTPASSKSEVESLMSSSSPSRRGAHRRSRSPRTRPVTTRSVRSSTSASSSTPPRARRRSSRGVHSESSSFPIRTRSQSRCAATSTGGERKTTTL